MLRFVLICCCVFLSCGMAGFAKAEDSKFIPVKPMDMERPLFILDQIALQMRTLKGYSDAEFETALRYYYGYKKRLDVEFKQDYGKAAEWFKKAAAQGHVESAYFLGHMFETGQGVPQNIANAIKAYTFASDKNLEQAKHSLADLYYKLYLNTPEFADFEKQNYLNKSKELYSELAENNFPRGSYNLAIIKLDTEINTRDLLKNVNDLLINALDAFISENDRENSLKISKLMRDKKLNRYTDSMNMFRQAFIGDKTPQITE